MTFSPDYDEDATSPAGLTPAQLPTAGLLDQLKASQQLRTQTFTAVGYGTVREDKTGGPHGLLDSDGVRMDALQSAQPRHLSGVPRRDR